MSELKTTEVNVSGYTKNLIKLLGGNKADTEFNSELTKNTIPLDYVIENKLTGVSNINLIPDNGMLLISIHTAMQPLLIKTLYNNVTDSVNYKDIKIDLLVVEGVASKLRGYSLNEVIKIKPGKGLIFIEVPENKRSVKHLATTTYKEGNSSLYKDLAKVEVIEYAFIDSYDVLCIDSNLVAYNKFYEELKFKLDLK
jgi:hypothetical protein